MDLAYHNTYNCIISLIKERYEGPLKEPFVLLDHVMEPITDQFKEKGQIAFDKLLQEGKIHLGPGQKIFLKQGGNIQRTISRFPRLLVTESSLA